MTPSKRREGRKRVTLIAGLVCGNSIVFAADSEESGTLRKSVEKLSHTEQSAARALSGPSSTIIVGGAGNGTIADYATQSIIEQTSELTSLANIETKIHQILRDIFENHIPLHPRPEDASIELLIGIKAPDFHRPVLYSTEGVTVVKRSKYHVCGTGSLIEYVLDRLYERNMSVEDGISAALIMLQLAKSYVSGVGGDSNIAILRDTGVIEHKIKWELAQRETIAKQYSEITGRLLLATFRTSSGSEDDFNQEVQIFSEQLNGLRQRKHEADLAIKSYLALMEQRIEAGSSNLEQVDANKDDPKESN
jgi:20S proteasome alpha/beta subunit